MPEPTGSEARLHSLRRRWETEKSTAFLPLAEEYRRLGRLRDAIDVLETGLRANPGYTSGMVALGRCRLESGDPSAAARVLEQVVAHDPEQLVASKLLIEAYLRTGRAGEARARLASYSALNPKDPEIARLAERIDHAAGQPPRPAPPPAPLPAVPAAAAPDLFAMAAEPVPPAPDLSRLFDERPVAAAPALPPPAIGPGSRLFHGLDGPVVVSRYLRGLAAEGLFPLVFPAAPLAAPPEPVAAERAASMAEPAVLPPELEPAEPPSPEAPAAAEPVVAERAASMAEPAVLLPELEPAEPPSLEAPAAAEPVVAAPVPPPEPPPEPIAPPAPAPEAHIAAKFVSTAPKPEIEPFDADVERAISGFVPAPPAPAPVTAPPAETVAPTPPPPEATTTLGDLYLQQGHAAEAERIFGAVLGRDPRNDEARRGLDQAQERLRASAGGLSARRAVALREYLRRLKRREERHVP